MIDIQHHHHEINCRYEKSARGANFCNNALSAEGRLGLQLITPPHTAKSSHNAKGEREIMKEVVALV